MFGGQASQASGGSSLFGNLGSTAPAEGPAKKRGLFDSAPGTAAPASSSTSAPSLFGGFGASTAQPAPPGSSIFGSKPTASAPSSGLFGQSTSQPAASSSIFGATTTTANNPLNQSSQQPLSQSTRDPAYFNSLLERGRKRAHPSDGASQTGRLGQIPGLHLGLDDIARRAQEIGGRSGRGTPVNGADSRAHYLLSASGIAPGKALRDFEAIEVPPVERPAESFDPDNERYLRGLQQRGRDAMIKESMERVQREFDAYLEESLAINFDEQRQRIMEHFGLVPKDAASHANGSPAGGGFGRSSRRGKNVFAESAKGSTTRSVFGRSGMEKSIIGNPGLEASTTRFFADDSTVNTNSNRMQDHTMWDKEGYFADKVQTLNASRLREKSFPILQEFAYVEENGGGDTPQQIVQAYQALIEVVKEGPNPPSERQFASAYLDEHPNSPRAVKLRKQILDGSKRYLEKMFYRELETLIEKSPREAQLGGRPTVTNKIRAYIRVRSARKDLAPDGTELQQLGDDGDYCWILIFFLLRCGFVKEAAEYVNGDPAFQSTDKRFVAYLTAYSNSPDRRLNRKLQEMINGEYQQRMRIAPDNTIDPYRMACYQIVGRCDLRNRKIEGINQGVEDWIWLQFNLARELDRNEEVAGDIYGLEQICETVREIGQRHFQKGSEGSSGFATFFLMQVLAGTFETAIQYLHSYLPVSAVHFAIALDYYGLLRVSDFAVAGNELCKSNPPFSKSFGLTIAVTTTTKGLPQINFVPLIAFYTSSWRTANAVAAVDYLALLCLNADLPALGASYISYCHESLRELCLETREFAKLLGDIRSDGIRLPGAIEQRSKLIKIDDRQDFLQAVTRQSAQIADERGQVADAALLYHLAEDLDSVAEVLSRAIADAVGVDLDDTPPSLQPLKPRKDIEPGDAQTNSSLSLTNAATTYELARNMMRLYDANASYYDKIQPENKRVLGALMMMMESRELISAGKYMDALDRMNSLEILPLLARGNKSVIRTAVSSFAILPQMLARTTGFLVVWSITCIARQREQLQQARYETAERINMKTQLADMASDLVDFSGLIKFRLAPRVNEMLARISGEVGVY